MRMCDFETWFFFSVRGTRIFNYYKANSKTNEHDDLKRN